MASQNDIKKVRWRTFLKDVFICSLGAYNDTVH